VGDRARQFILDNYTWDKIALKMVSVYEDIIDDQLTPTFSEHKS